MNALIVEDNKPVSLVLSRVVEDMGLGAVMAARGEVALNLFRQRDIGIVILDVELPDTDGFTVAREIRNEAGPDIPIIFISGNAGEAYVQQSRDAGGDEFLAKPVQPSKLKEVLARYTHHQRV